MNKGDLVNEVAKVVKTKKQAQAALDCVMSSITKALKKGPFSDGNYLTVAFKVLPATNLGALEAFILSTSPVRGLRARGGFEVSMRWEDRELVDAAVVSRLGWHISVRYAGMEVHLETEAGRTFLLTPDLRIR